MTGWRDVENERIEIQFLAARRIMWSVFTGAGGKIREEQIWPLEADKRERERLIKQFGFATVTENSGVQQ